MESTNIDFGEFSIKLGHPYKKNKGAAPEISERGGVTPQNVITSCVIIFPRYRILLHYLSKVIPFCVTMTFCASYYILWRNRGGALIPTVLKRGGGSQKVICAPRDVFCTNIPRRSFQNCRQRGGGGGGGRWGHGPPSLNPSLVNRLSSNYQ